MLKITKNNKNNRNIHLNVDKIQEMIHNNLKSCATKGSPVSHFIYKSGGFS